MIAVIQKSIWVKKIGKTTFETSKAQNMNQVHYIKTVCSSITLSEDAATILSDILEQSFELC